jgi:hypothetical protein
VIGLTRLAAVVFVAGAVVSHRMAAQEITDYGPFWQRSLHAGLDIGTAIPTGTFGENFGAGWDVGGNVALPVSPHGSIWLQADGNYESNLVRGATAAAYGANGGGASLTSATLNVVLNKRDYWGNLTPYLVFGGGAYWRLVELNNFAGGTYCNAFDGFCGVYGAAVPVRSRSEFDPGWDGGGGIRFRLPPVRLFLEARYNAVYGRHGTTSYVPIVFGTEL